MSPRFRSLLAMLRESFAEWQKDNAMRLAAALAYYTVFSLAPLMLAIISIAGLAMGQEAAAGQIHDEMSTIVGPEPAKSIQELVAASRHPQTSVFGMIMAFALVLFGASGVFGELKESLNIIWGTRAKEGSGIWNFIRGRFLSITMVMGVCFLLLVSLVLSSLLTTFFNYSSGFMPGIGILFRILTMVVSLALITALFAMMFKWLPDTRVEWRDVLVGAFATALLFTLGKTGLEIYFARAAVASSYGAAGGLALMLVWVYYSAQIFFFGAEFTEVYARRSGSRKGLADSPSAEEAAPAAGASAPAVSGLAPAGVHKSPAPAAAGFAATVGPAPATAATEKFLPALPPGSGKRLAALGALTLTGWAMEKLQERRRAPVEPAAKPSSSPL